MANDIAGLRYELEKRAKRKREFPIGTVAWYGPTASRASKVAVSIFLSEKSDPDILERWFAEERDVRDDFDVLRNILDLLKRHDVKSVAMSDRIIGCPHEEGIDYTEGQPCPQCPYWAGRDRWTGERVQ